MPCCVSNADAINSAGSPNSPNSTSSIAVTKYSSTTISLYCLIFYSSTAVYSYTSLIYKVPGF